MHLFILLLHWYLEAMGYGSRKRDCCHKPVGILVSPVLLCMRRYWAEHETAEQYHVRYHQLDITLQPADEGLIISEMKPNQEIFEVPTF